VSRSDTEAADHAQGTIDETPSSIGSVVPFVWAAVMAAEISHGRAIVVQLGPEVCGLTRPFAGTLLVSTGGVVWVDSECAGVAP
jgi:hypothetical protein